MNLKIQFLPRSGKFPSPSKESAYGADNISMAEEYGADVVLHLDHAKDYDEIRKAIDCGYSSVMFDGSSLPLKDNILGTKRVVEYAKSRGVSVEAELGTVGGTEDGIAVNAEEARYTDPADAVEFVKCTGIDALAVAIGTNHAAE